MLTNYYSSHPIHPTPFDSYTSKPLIPFNLDQDIGDLDYTHSEDEDSSTTLSSEDIDVYTDMYGTHLMADTDKENKAPNKTLTNNKINSLNRSNAFNLRDRTNQKITHPKIAKVPKYSRKLHPTEIAASITQKESDKVKGISNDHSIKHHAFMRIQAFALTVAGLYGIANRSDNKKDREMNISVKSAPLQVGKASHSGKNKYHAAHDNATSGLDLEDFRESLIKEIVEDAEITPLKKRLLKSKKFSEEQLAGILKNPDENSVRTIFDTVWPIDKKKPHTVFTGTQTDLSLNTTTEAGIEVNLGIDKRIEGHRDEIAKLYLQITRAEITREEACTLYCNLIKDELEKLELDIGDCIALINNYQEKLLELEDHALLSNESIREILGDLHKKAKIISPPKKKTNGPKEKSTESKNGPAILPKLPSNKMFLKNSIYSIDNNKYDPLSSFKIWMGKRWESIKKEIEDQQKKLTTYLKYCILEKEGTQVPDFTALFGEFNPNTGKRELNKEILANVQEKLWRPMSPTVLNETKRRRPDLEIEENLPEAQSKKSRRLSI